MDQIRDFSDERLRSSCIHCSDALTASTTSRDHVPTKGLLLKPYPENLPVVPVCLSCNNRFSSDEEYLIAFLSVVSCGSTEPEAQANAKAERILKRNSKLRDRIERAKQEYETLGGDVRITWRPEQQRITNVIVKNARGHVFFELSEPIFSAPLVAASTPLIALNQEQRVSFEPFVNRGLEGQPEVGSRMMQRIMTRQETIGDWVIVQNGIYRYAIHYGPPTIVRSVIHEYLATEVMWDDY